MNDWLSTLNPEERASWDEYVEHVRRETVHKMDQSAFVASLIPREGFDVKFATELGMAIMLNKPIVAVCQPGGAVPPMLQKIAYAVVEADIDTGAGAAQMAEVIKRLAEEMKGS